MDKQSKYSHAQYKYVQYQGLNVNSCLSYKALWNGRSLFR